MYQFNYLKQLPEYQKPFMGGSVIIGLFETIIVLALVITTSYVVHSNKKTQQLNMVKKELDKTTVEYDSLKMKYPDLIGAVNLENKIKSMTMMNKNLEKNIDRIVNSELKSGFSKYFYFFAQNTPSSAWFTNIYIDLPYSNINLKGFSLDKDSISNLVKVIDDKSTFGGKNLSDFKIADVSQEGSSPKFSFHLGTDELVELEDLVGETQQQEQEIAKAKAKAEEQKAKSELSEQEVPEQKPEKKRKKLTEMKQYYIQDNDPYRNRRENSSGRSNKGYF